MDPELLTLEAAARVAGHARWVETRLFEVLGGWVQAEPDPAAKIFWSTRSRRHAEHAHGWHQRQARVAHLDADALTSPAGARATALLEALAGVREPGETALRLAAFSRVVIPALVAAYRVRVERAHPLADAPVVAWIRGVVADEAAACRQATELLDRPGLVSDAGSLDVAERGLATLVGPDGDLIGLGPPPV